MDTTEPTLVSTIEDTDENLLVIISMKDEPEARREAFNTFYGRYADFLYCLLEKVGDRKLNEEERREILGQTFMKVFEYSVSFDTRGAVGKEAIAKRIRGWLAVILKNESLNYLKGRLIASEETENYGKMVEACNSAVSDEPSFSQKILSEALSTLSERDQLILMTYWEFQEPGIGSQSKNMPQDVLESLCERCSTSKANVRQVVHRGAEKIRKYIESRYPDSL